MHSSFVSSRVAPPSRHSSLLTSPAFTLPSIPIPLPQRTPSDPYLDSFYSSLFSPSPCSFVRSLPSKHTSPISSTVDLTSSSLSSSPPSTHSHLLASNTLDQIFSPPLPQFRSIHSTLAPPTPLVHHSALLSPPSISSSRIVQAAFKPQYQYSYDHHINQSVTYTPQAYPGAPHYSSPPVALESPLSVLMPHLPRSVKRARVDEPRKGPIPGAVANLRQEVESLKKKLELIKLRNAVEKQLLDSIDATSQTVIRNFLSHINAERHQACVQDFFFQLNNSLFPILDRSEFLVEHMRFSQDTTTLPPLWWCLQYAACIAIASSMNGDAVFARQAASVARIISCALFDVANYHVVRGFMLLSYYLIGQQQMKRASCCLAIVKRMLFVVPMYHSDSIVKCTSTSVQPLNKLEHKRLHQQLKLLTTFLEDMMQSSPWWKQQNNSSAGDFTTLLSESPQSLMDVENSVPSFSATRSLSMQSWPDASIQQSAALHNSDVIEELDAANITTIDTSQLMPQQSENVDIVYNTFDPTSLRAGKLGAFEFALRESLFQDDSPPAPVKLPPNSTLRPNTPQSDVETPVDTSVNLPLSLLNDINNDLQLNLMKVMGTISSIKGNLSVFKQNPHSVVVLHKCLSVVDDAERRIQQQHANSSTLSPIILSIRVLVMYMKAIILRLMLFVGVGDDQSFAAMCETAKTASVLSQQNDLAFCPFIAIYSHLTAQIHLSTLSTSSIHSSFSSSSLQYIVFDLLNLKHLALRWEFARPLFVNLQKRVWHHLTSSLSPEHTRTLEPHLLQLLTMTLPSVFNNINNEHFITATNLSFLVSHANSQSFSNSIDSEFCINNNNKNLKSPSSKVKSRKRSRVASSFDEYSSDEHSCDTDFDVTDTAFNNNFSLLSSDHDFPLELCTPHDQQLNEQGHQSTSPTQSSDSSSSSSSKSPPLSYIYASESASHSIHKHFPVYSQPTPSPPAASSSSFDAFPLGNSRRATPFANSSAAFATFDGVLSLSPVVMPDPMPEQFNNMPLFSLDGDVHQHSEEEENSLPINNNNNDMSWGDHVTDITRSSSPMSLFPSSNDFNLPLSPCSSPALSLSRCASTSSQSRELDLSFFQSNSSSN